MRSYLFQLNRAYDDLPEPRRGMVLLLPFIMLEVLNILISMYSAFPENVFVFFAAIILIPFRLFYLKGWYGSQKPN